jgi:predicted transcriptional regulator
MDVVFRLGKASAAEIHQALTEPPSYTAVRTLLGILEQKGHLGHIVDGPRFIYEPTAPREEVAQSAMQGMLETFFNGSLELAVASFLNQKDSQVSAEELDRLATLIEAARAEEK